MRAEALVVHAASGETLATACGATLGREAALLSYCCD